jgi:hypothetical protein
MLPSADLSVLCRATISQFAAADADLAAQQAVRGLDALDELALHPLIASGLEPVGCGVEREVWYPGDPPRRARRSERQRCDFALTPLPVQGIADPTELLVQRDHAAATLFAGLPAEAPAGAPPGAPPEECLWIEAKTLGQFAYRDGAPGPNPSYTSELVGGPGRDIAKLVRDGGITMGAVLIVLFCQSEEVARHDIAQAVMRWLDRDLPVAEPIIDGLPIQERIGNAWCAVAMARVRASG